MKTFIKICLVYIAALLLAEISVRVFFPEYRSLNHGKGVTGGVSFKLNSYGLRDYEFAIEKKDKYRILCLGDSITFGTQNRLEDIFPKALERILNNGSRVGRYQVVNAGGVGGNPAFEYDYLKEKGILFKPDYVILGLCLNDIGNCFSINSRRDSFLKEPNFWRNVDDFRIYQESLTKWDRSLPFAANMKVKLNALRWYLRTKSYLFSFIDANMLRFMYGTGIKKYAFDKGEKEQILAFGIDPTSEEGWQLLFAALIDIRNFLAERNIGFLVVVFPYEFQLSEDKKDNFFNIDKTKFTINPQNRLIEFGRSNDIEVLDLLPYFKKIDKKIYFPLDYIHPNVYGHRVVAEQIYEMLKKKLR